MGKKIDDIEIKIPITQIRRYNMNIEEYLTLYDLINKKVISDVFKSDVHKVSNLEKKGFIKIINGKIHLRERGLVLFHNDNDLFLEWLNTYPVFVKTSTGRRRALSPKDPETTLGKTLQIKWKNVFRGDPEKQQKAINVLKAQLKDMEKTGDLEWMVEATRWLNQGYYEKYDYLLDQDIDEQQYENEDYL